MRDLFGAEKVDGASSSSLGCDHATALEAIENRDKDFVGKSPCDWAYHIMLHSEPPPEFCSQLAEAIQAGYPTLKIFTTNILPSPHGRYAVWIRGRPNPKVPVLRIKPRKLIARDHVHDRAKSPP
jgi:hypothetical protein